MIPIPVMAEKHRYCRVILEMEVEVVDQTSLDTFHFDYTTDEDGNIVMMDSPDQDLPGCPGSGQQYRVGGALQTVLSAALGTTDAGLKFMGGSVLPRARRNGVYEQITIGELPARNDDGSLPDQRR